MDELKQDVEDFISVLNDECDLLKKKGLMPPSIIEPWRCYSEPLEDEHGHEHLRAALEAGRYTIEAETHISEGDESNAWRALAKAQAALLNSISSLGRRMAKRAGNARGGDSKSDDVRYKIFCIAEDLRLAGHSERGLAAKVSKKLSELYGINKDENKINAILKHQQHLQVNV